MEQHTLPRPSAPRNWISGFFAAGAAAMLQFAALAKISAPSADPNHMTDLFGLFEEPVSRDLIIGYSEMVVVLLILLFHRWWLTWAGVTLLFSAFLGYASWAAYIGTNCGCFGDLWIPPKWFSITVDATLAVAGIALAAAYGRRLRGIAVIAVLALVCAGVGLAYGKADLGEGREAEVERLSATANAQKDQPPSDAPENTAAHSDNNNQDDNLGASEDPPPAQNPQARTLPGGDESRLAAARALLDLPINEDLRAMTPDQHATYLFVHSPDCHTCEEFKVVIDPVEQQLESTQDAFLRVRQFNKYDLRDTHGLATVLWEPTPAVIVVWGGAVVATWNGEQAPLPGTFNTSDGVYSMILDGTIAPPAE